MNKLRGFVPVLLLLALSVAGLLLLPDYSFSNPFQSSLYYDYPVYATGDSDGNSYVIDTSLRRVSKVSPDGNNRYVIQGGVRDGSSFFYATQIAAGDDGRLFLLDELRDEKGFYALRERILIYGADGNPEGELLRIDYPEGHHDPSLVQRTRIIAMEPAGSRALDFAILVPDGLEIRRILLNPGDGRGSAEPETIARYPLENAILNIADVSIGRGRTAASLRDGRILALSPDGDHALLYDAAAISAETGDRVVPWELDETPDGELYFIDLEARSVKNIDGQVIVDRDLVASAADLPDLYPYDYYRMDVSSDGELYVPVDEGLVVLEADGDLRFLDSAALPLSVRILTLVWWLAAAGLLISLVWGIWLIYDRVMQRHLPPVLVSALAVVALVAIVGGLSSFLLIENFNGRYTDVIFNRIQQMIQVFPLVIDGDVFESIDSQDDFGNDAYLTIRQDLLDAFNQNRDDWNRGYYFALYRIIDERLYGFMYMNGAIGMYHPFDWLGGEEDPGVYDLASQGKIATEMITDISGDWIYGVGPIYNSDGEVVGLFETGTDLYTLTLENQRLIRDLVWELVTLWIVLMLLLVEITVLGNLIRERRKARVPLSDADRGFSDGDLARPLVFLFFTAVSFSIAFLPLLSRDLYQAIPGFSRDVVIALPLSIEMAMFGIATVFTGFLTQRVGWKPIFSISLLVGAGGLLLSAISGNLGLFLGARALTGLGSGMGYIALRSFINLEGRRDKRNAAYSNFYSGMIAGINVGLVLGASLAAIIGYRTVFLVGLALMAVTAMIFFALYRETKYFYKAPAMKQLGNTSAILSLIKSPRLWLYFILLVLPTYVAASYIGFYFPLFGEAQGLSTPEIGRFMIMNGLFIVYLGPPLARFVHKRFGDYWGSILGSVFWGLALVFAGLSGNMLTASLVLIFMGLTEGFAVGAQNGLFFHEKAVVSAGEDRATGYFELFGKIGETIGPMVFAAVLVLGQRSGLMLLGILVIGLSLPYVLLVRHKGDRA
jgi:MFS family permease